AVVALVDDEGSLPGLAEAAEVQLVGAQEVERLDRAVLATLIDALEVAAPLARQEAELEAANACRSGVRHVEAVPAVLDHAVTLGDATGGGEHRRAVRPRERAHAEDQHRPLGLLQDAGEGAVALGNRF